MKKRYFLLLVPIVPIGIVVGVTMFSLLPWVLLFFGMSLQPSPAAPEITYGEFPFRLEYEINGERYVVEDTLICEYDGVGINEGQGKYRKWKERLASGRDEILLLKVNESKIIYYSPGSARYYMGDMDEDVTYEHCFPNALRFEKTESGSSKGIIFAEELWSQYKIKLISWDYTPPIVNHFGT